MARRTGPIAGAILALGLIAVTASAQRFGGGLLGGGGSISMLATIPEVQAELNLNDDQKTRIAALAVREKLRASFAQANSQELQNLPEEERQNRLDALRKKADAIGKGIDEKVGKILDAKQAMRLRQLWLQSQGARALTRPEVIEKLGLTQDQQARIKKIQADARPAGRPGFGPNQSPEERQAAMKRMRDQIEKAQKESLAVLNDDQMLDWTHMCGKTFKFPAGRSPGRGNPPHPPAAAPP